MRSPMTLVDIWNMLPATLLATEPSRDTRRLGHQPSGIDIERHTRDGGEVGADFVALDCTFEGVMAPVWRNA
jgi:hypothetical protein